MVGLFDCDSLAKSGDLVTGGAEWIQCLVGVFRVETGQPYGRTSVNAI